MNVQFSLSANSSASHRKPEFAAGGSMTPVGNQLPGNSDAQRAEQAVEKVNHKSSVAEQQLLRTIERAVQALQGPETTLDISIHEKTNDIMVKVLNKDTGEIIREIPREKTLDLVAKMMEIAGIIVDEKI